MVSPTSLLGLLVLELVRSPTFYGSAGPKDIAATFLIHGQSAMPYRRPDVNRTDLIPYGNSGSNPKSKIVLDGGSPAVDDSNQDVCATLAP